TLLLTFPGPAPPHTDLLSLPAALPISLSDLAAQASGRRRLVAVLHFKNAPRSMETNEQIGHAAADLGEIDHEGTDSPKRLDDGRSEEHTSELQSRVDLVCRLLIENKKQ